MTPSVAAQPIGSTDAAEQWRRLDPRMLAVHPVRQLASLLPVLLVLLFTGQGGGWQLWVSIAAPVLVVASSVVRWCTTRYRVTDERVELGGGLVNRQLRSLRRDRVRTVDVTASPMHRLFRLGVVEIGTGSGSGRSAGTARLKLDAVPAAEAERLRSALLNRSAVTAPASQSRPSLPAGSRPPLPAGSRPPLPASGLPASGLRSPALPASGIPSQAPPVTTLPATATRAQTIAQFSRSWLRFAPLTTAGLVAIGALAGTAFNLFNEFGLAPTGIGVVRRAGEELSGVPVAVAVAIVVAGIVLLGGLGSLVIYIEGWWNYRLTREPDDTLLVRRGLLTTRALSVEQDRMRGAEVSEPLLLRAGRGARCIAVTTGLEHRPSSGTLLPPAPRAEAHRVAAAALHTTADQVTSAPLARHPRAALGRRLTRALVPSLVVVATAIAVREPLQGQWPVSLVLLPIAVLVAVDRYRNLGHALTAGYLVVRQGSLRRRTAALQRSGIIGWKARQSIFQRRTGLVSLHAITAAHSGHYTAVDISLHRAFELVEEVNPGLLPSP